MMKLPTEQRVINDLKRTRLSRRRMIWAPSHPLLHPSVSCLSFSDFLCVAGRGYWWEKAWSSTYKPMNTLCLVPLRLHGFISLMSTSTLVSSSVIYFMEGGKDLVRNPRACYACTHELFIIRNLGTEIRIFCTGCTMIAAQKIVSHMYNTYFM